MAYVALFIFWVKYVEYDMAKARNMKMVLCLFEQLSGLKINFNKSELFCFGRAKEEQDNYRQLFGCELGAPPFRYLEIPIHHRKLSNKEWEYITDWFKKKNGVVGRAILCLTGDNLFSLTPCWWVYRWSFCLS